MLLLGWRRTIRFRRPRVTRTRRRPEQQRAAEPTPLCTTCRLQRPPQADPKPDVFSHPTGGRSAPERGAGDVAPAPRRGAGHRIGCEVGEIADKLVEEGEEHGGGSCPIDPRQRGRPSPDLLRFTPCRRREQAFELTQPGVRHSCMIERTGDVALIFGGIGVLLFLIPLAFTLTPLGHADRYRPAGATDRG
jgi:hypothetical protein